MFYIQNLPIVAAIKYVLPNPIVTAGFVSDLLMMCTCIYKLGFYLTGFKKTRKENTMMFIIKRFAIFFTIAIPSTRWSVDQIIGKS